MSLLEAILAVAQLGVSGVAFMLWSHVQDAKGIAKEAQNAAADAKREVLSHRVEVARDYATNTDLLRFEHKLDALLEKLERKADRS